MAQMRPVGTKEQRGENDVAQAAGNPHGDKQGDEHSDDKSEAHLFRAAHQNVAGGGPGTDENVCGVGV